MNINNNYTLKLQPNTIVFHNFHNKRSIKLQGSISSFKFEKIIIKLKKNYNLLNADKFYSKLLDGNLSKKDISLSFDDGLKSQYDIAIPILNKYNIKAFSLYLLVHLQIELINWSFINILDLHNLKL